VFFCFQAEDGIRDRNVTGVQTCALPISFRPTQGRYKVYIIDEVHMLSTGAFNALLKTLEEPPEYVIFILATTEANKIPVTILSRSEERRVGKERSRQVRT